MRALNSCNITLSQQLRTQRRPTLSLLLHIYHLGPLELIPISPGCDLGQRAAFQVLCTLISSLPFRTLLRPHFPPFLKLRVFPKALTRCFYISAVRGARHSACAPCLHSWPPVWSNGGVLLVSETVINVLQRWKRISRRPVSCFIQTFKLKLTFLAQVCLVWTMVVKIYLLP